MSYHPTCGWREEALATATQRLCAAVGWWFLLRRAPTHRSPLRPVRAVIVAVSRSWRTRIIVGGHFLLQLLLLHDLVVLLYREGIFIFIFHAKLQLPK